MADEGGAVIIDTPQIIRDITASKVSDPLRYKPLVSDRTNGIRKRLLELWSLCLQEDYVSVEQAKVIVGLIYNQEKDRFSQSTSDTKDT